MTHAHAPGGDHPSWEQLTAYADGELDPAARARLEEWLAGHPEAAAGVEAQRRLGRLCRETAPPEPAEADWAGVLGRIESRLRPAAALAGRRPWLGWLAGLGTAAALLLAVAWPRATPPGQTVRFARGAVAPLAVAAPDDVEIHSLADADRQALVLGEVPVKEKELLVLAAATDIHLESVAPDHDGMLPEFRHPSPEAPPMIWTTPQP